MLVNNGGVVASALSKPTIADAANTPAKEQAAGKEPDFFKGAGDAVAVDSLLDAWRTADKNKDGVTSRQELAGAAYSLLTQEYASAEDKGIGRILATLAMGGKEGTGLSELYNDGDGGISKKEIQELAARDGMGSQISKDDLKSALGARYVPGGRDIDLKELKDLSKSNPTDQSGDGDPDKDCPDPEDSGDGTSLPGSLLNIMTLFLQILNRYFASNPPAGSLQQRPLSTPLSTVGLQPRPGASLATSPLQQSSLLPKSGGLTLPQSALPQNALLQSALPQGPLQRSVLPQSFSPAAPQTFGVPQQQAGLLSVGLPPVQNLTTTTPFSNALGDPASLANPATTPNFTASLLQLTGNIMQLGSQVLNTPVR